MIRKLPVRVFQPVFGLFMALFMSCLMSGAITAINIGFPPDYLARWMRSWGLAFVLAYPAILIVGRLRGASRCTSSSRPCGAGEGLGFTRFPLAFAPASGCAGRWTVAR